MPLVMLVAGSRAMQRVSRTTPVTPLHTSKMSARMLVPMLAFALLTTAAALDSVRMPPVWPDQFHALLVRWFNRTESQQDDSLVAGSWPQGPLGVDALHYDWPGGNNLLVMRTANQEGATIDLQSSSGWYMYAPIISSKLTPN